MTKNTKNSIIGISLLCMIFLGIFTTITVAIGNYNVALTKGTEIFTVTIYDESAWESTVDSTTSPSSWFGGDSNQTGARSKNTIKGWNYVTWETYDVFVSLFLPLLFESEDLIPLIGLMNSQGYNETTINVNYTNSYNLWVGLRAVWNFTIGNFEEDPTIANDPLLIFKNPTDFNEILSNYNNLSAELNNLPAIQFSGYSFPILDPDELLWLFVFNGFTLGSPLNTYLEEFITTLDCQNVTVSNNVLTINRVGETNYTVEITYSIIGTISSFVVRDVSSNIIYKIVAINSDWIFFTTIIVLVICIAGLSTYLIIHKLRRNRRRNK